MQIIKKIGWKGFLTGIIVAVIAITIAGVMLMNSWQERRQNDLNRATEKISTNVVHMERLIGEWRNVWQGVALGQMSFEAGVKSLEEISVAAVEVGETIEKVSTPSWLESAPKSEFNNMKKDLRTSCSALSVAAKAGSQMLKSGLLTAKDLTVMAGYSKDATEYLNKTNVVLKKFKDGYGLEKNNNALPAKK